MAGTPTRPGECVARRPPTGWVFFFLESRLTTAKLGFYDPNSGHFYLLAGNSTSLSGTISLDFAAATIAIPSYFQPVVGDWR